jgi:hypothetical protein
VFFADRIETRFDSSLGLDTGDKDHRLEKHRLLDQRTAGHINTQVAKKISTSIFYGKQHKPATDKWIWIYRL